MTVTGGIVVGVDGSACSRTALRWAAQEARYRGADLTAVSVWMPLPMAYPMATPLGGITQAPGFEPEQTAQAVLEDTLTEVLGADLGGRVRSELIEGHPAEALIEASKHADLLVVGTRGHGGFAGMLLGSVSQHVAAHASCTVAVVRGD